MPVLAGRLSRAAVFASATLAGCATAPPQKRLDERQQLPDDHQQRQPDDRQVESPPPDATFAQPPDGNFAKPPVTTATIRGIVTGSSLPRRGLNVSLHPPGGGQIHTQTDGNGVYVFHDLEPGNYAISVQQPRSSNPREGSPPPLLRRVKLVAGAVEEVDFAITEPETEPIDRGPCCKPYGAPPARRRVV